MAKGNGLLCDAVIDALHYRINEEEKSARLYLAMSNWLEYAGYLGASKLWKKYSDEETEHARWAQEFLLANDYIPRLDVLPEPQNKFKSLVDVIELSYRHEIEITKQCNELARVANENDCYQCATLAYKYLAEQTEELEKTNNWAAMIATSGTSDAVLRLIDEEMGDKAEE